LALAFEAKHNMTNKLPPILAKHYTQKTIFHRPGEQPTRKIVAQDNWKLLGTEKMLADLDQRLIFPLEIAITNL